jgi:hypothetical protein
VDERAIRFDPQRLDVRDGRALRRRRVFEERSCRRDGDRQLVRAERGQVSRFELAAQVAPRRIEVEMPGG